MRFTKESKNQGNSLEPETFWQEQIEEFHKTKLTRQAFCRERKLNYHHFQYRYRKLVLSQKKKVLKPIPIQVNTIPDTDRRHSSLCTLKFSSGQQLTVYDHTVLNILLERLFVKLQT